jgi:hypothetical protein
MTFSGNTRSRADDAGDSVPGVRANPSDRLTDTAAARVAYVIADGHGSCLDATDPALELLGTDIDTLRMLRVGDLTKPDSPDSLTRQLIASCDNVGNWLSGTCELLRADGATLTVRFGTIRLKSGELAARFEPLDRQPTNADSPRQVLEAWRHQELALAWTAPGSAEHRIAELEALWLGAEYQRLALARAETNGDAP